MAFKKIFCPNCGTETQINDEKDFCFCLECGYKIQISKSVVSQKEEKTIFNEMEKVPEKSDIPQENANNILEEKLKEVEFYYNLSRDKKEAAKINEEPRYYLKGQDLLIDLSQQFPNDYRIWWELCKPVDFYDAESGVDINGQYSINEGHFEKALDLAKIEEKKKLVSAHDKYCSDKKASLNLVLEKRKEKEKEQIELENAKKEQELKKQQELKEQEIKKQQELIEQTKQKEQELLQQKLEDQRLVEECRQNPGVESKALWEKLADRDYSLVDSSYFKIKVDNQMYTFIFSKSGNGLYLIAYRIDELRNVVYLEQTAMVVFEGDGLIKKFKNIPLRIRGYLPPNDQLHIYADPKGRIYVNDVELTKDVEYTENIRKVSKKPILLKKIFL